VPSFGVAAAPIVPNVTPVTALLRLPLLLAVALPVGAETAAPSLQGLVANSPFGSAAVSGPTAAAAPLEFRGTFLDGGERFFSVLDPATRRAEWVGLNEPGRAFTVKAFNAEQESITVDFQGRPLDLKLHSARIAFAPAVAGAGAPAPGPTPQAQALPSTGEAQRLAQVAEEIRRRRALRQQAQQAQPPPAAPPRN
jgi:hypothetical protein